MTILRHQAGALCVMVLLGLTAVASVLCAVSADLRLSLVFLVLTAVVCAVLAGMQFGKERVTTASVHLFSVWLMLAFAPLLEYRGGLFDRHYAAYHFFPFVPSSEELILASIAVSLWAAFFVLGYRSNVDRAVKWIESNNTHLGYSALVAQSILGFAALAYIYAQVGFGVFTRFGFEAFEYETPGEFTFFTSTVRSVPLIALLGLVLMLRNGTLHGIQKTTAVLLATVLLVGNALINNPLAAARFFTGTVLLAFAFVLVFYRSRNGLSFLLVAIFSFFVLFQLLDVGRLVGDVHEIIDDAPTLVDNMFSGDPYRTFEAIPAAVRYLDQYGSTYGFQLLGPLLFWVPRSLWPGKPEGSGTMLAGALGGFHDNISCPAPCEALVNFGWLGIAIIAVLFAIVLRIVDDVSRNAASAGPLADGIRLMDLLYPLLLGQTLFITRGDFLSPWAFTVGMIIAVLPLAIAQWLTKAVSLLLWGKYGKAPRS